MEHQAASVIIGRMPRTQGNQFKTCFIKLFSNTKPFSEGFPEQELTFPNIEKVIFQGLMPHYYLEGNDLVVEQSTSISIQQDASVLTVTIR